MKKLYILAAAFALVANMCVAQTICTVNPQAQTAPGISPPSSEIPCVVVGENYNQIIQVQNLSSYGIGGIASVQVDSMVLDSIIGLPPGLDWIKSSNALQGGQNGCLTFFGTTNAAPGTYPLTWYGTFWASAIGQSVPPYTGNLNTVANLVGGSGFKYSLNVINPGDQCSNIPTGINNFSAALNSAIYIYPNPSNGIFELSLNAGERVNGDIAIYDITGNKVFSQQLDVIGYYNTSIDLSRFAKGLYTLQLRTPDGFASKRISVE
jgi:hypothetical protein